LGASGDEQVDRRDRLQWPGEVGLALNATLHTEEAVEINGAIGPLEGG
jgi:hypothetical protein